MTNDLSSIGLAAIVELGLERSAYPNVLEQPERAQAQFNVGRYYYYKAMAVTESHPNLTRKEFRKQVTPLYREAMPYFEKALEQDSGNEEVRNALRNIYYRLGEGRKLEALDHK